MDSAPSLTWCTPPSRHTCNGASGAYCLCHGVAGREQVRSANLCTRLLQPKLGRRFPVQIDGISARTVFGGLSSVQTQLGPLLEAFPGWDRTWIKLSAGQVRIVLLRSGEGTAPSSPSAAWERPTIKAL